MFWKQGGSVINREVMWSNLCLEKMTLALGGVGAGKVGAERNDKLGIVSPTSTEMYLVLCHQCLERFLLIPDSVRLG